jgi:hypothetical protein
MRVRYTDMRCVSVEVHAHEMHAHNVQARETHAREMHACETPAHEMHTREMYTCEIYAHRSMAFWGVMAVRLLQRAASELRYLHSPATMTSTRFIMHNKHP